MSQKPAPYVCLELAITLICFAIPKMHIHAHKLLCQLLHLLNLIFGSVQVDTEAIKHAWAGIGGVAMSTRDMGPGTHHDVLDCQFSHWNWQKLVGIIELLQCHLDRVQDELKEQTKALEEFLSQQAERIPEWQRQVLEFEQDQMKPNPFYVKVKGLMEAQVRLQFMKEEADKAARGVLAVHDISPSLFISAGLDLEEEQQHVRVQGELKKAATTGMQIDLAAMQTKLNRGITQFRKIQATYMPATLQLLGDMQLPSTALAEDVPLLLLSALTEAQRVRCCTGLEHIEAWMCNVQRWTNLTWLQNQLHIKSHLLTYKNHVRHQGANTRSQTIVTQNESKIRLHSEKDQTVWEALGKLNGGDETLVGWRGLKREDIHCIEDAEDSCKKEKQHAKWEAKHRAKNSELRKHRLLPVEVDEDIDTEDEGISRGAENRHFTGGMVQGFHPDPALGQGSSVTHKEFRRICATFNHEEHRWQQCTAAVPISVILHMDTEAAVAYALHHADMYQDLQECGIKWWSAMGAEARAEQVTREDGCYGHAMDNNDVDMEADEVADEDERACSNVKSDEEYILGGEGYDD
ncbi:hypothetical protein MSAN_00917800 [Mycena sanguinolenta]|uniref:Uncharacterized protein n=1 Tax=Mycena sanguinolenta TaxID=230812 RepID=A0A8H6YSY8_9AGAR|nr:hypothetical protein MSAN_00917800 [Mycena sanguinolenta]